MKSKGKSAHDLANDPRLSSLAGDVDPVADAPTKATEQDIASVREKLQQLNEASKTSFKDKESSSSSRL